LRGLKRFAEENLNVAAEYGKWVTRGGVDVEEIEPNIVQTHPTGKTHWSKNRGPLRILVCKWAISG
jgi:hypothetical protein